MPSFNTLKAHILSLIRPKIRTTFGVREFDIFFQLRMNLSPLRNQKKHHNVACKCNQGAEDTHHFLFECPRYATHRATLAVKVIDILQRKNLNHLGNQLELYLDWHHSLNLIDNRKILLATMKYIKGSQRFST